MRKEVLAITLGALASLASCSKVHRVKINQEVSTWECTEVISSTAPMTSTITSTASTMTTTTTAIETTTTESTTTQTTTTTATATEPVVTEAESDQEQSEPLAGYWDCTYYTAVALGHTSQPCGASGNLLVSGYSVASDYFLYGTLLYIESAYMNGTFRVDDCGVGNSNTIDFYFWDSSEVPSGFLQAGRIPISITIIE